MVISIICSFSIKKRTKAVKSFAESAEYLDMEMINPFEIVGEATRYQLFRPRYHHLPFNHIYQLIGKKFEFSLDVACGTGHSTEALAQFSQRIVGLDLSETMLAEAKKNSSLEFIKGEAENLPFADGVFDFLNISMGYHWLDQETFLKEAKRVLRPGGYLSIDNYGFIGKISADPKKQKLHFDFFNNYFPPAARRYGAPTKNLINLFGLILVKEISYEHEVVMTAHEFTQLLITWSNYLVINELDKTFVSKKMDQVYGEIFEGASLSLGFAGKTFLYQFKEKT